MKFLLLIAAFLSGCAALQPKPPAHYDQLIAQQDREISALLERQKLLRTHLEQCDDPTQSPPNIFYEIKQVLGPMGIELSRQGRRVTVHLPNSLVFTSSSKPRIRKDAAMLLDLLSHALRQHASHQLIVEAHTDNRKPSSSGYPSNWEKGSSYAAAFIRELVKKYKVEEGRFTVSSRGHMDPISENSTSEGRAKNRRILLHIIPRE